MWYPRLEIMIPPLRRNMNALLVKGQQRSMETVAVTKGFCADHTMIELLRETGYRKFADANLKNLLKLRQWFGDTVELQLIRVPMMTELFPLVKSGVIPHVSHREILIELDDLSRRCGQVTRVFLAVEAGDGREGFLPEEILELRDFFRRLRGIQVVGLSTTMACLSGVLPVPQTARLLETLKKELAGSIDRNDLMISVGGTTFLAGWENGDVPAVVDQIRCGEAWLFGTDISRKYMFPWLEHNTFFLSAEIVEVKRKTPLPGQARGYDAFGRMNCISRRKGDGMQLLVACGLQDVDDTQLYLNDDHVTIVGATSNYLVLDVDRDSDRFFPGKVVCFRAGYGTLIRAFLSPYVDKVYLQQEKVVDDESGVPRERFS